MTAALVALCALGGLAVGSFVNVVVWRVPRGESVVRPPSACPGCGHRIRPRDNVPLLSWALLRGRCRDCAAPISTRYPLVELATALLFAAMAARFGASAALPAFLLLAALGLALALIDADTGRLPNVLTLPAYPVGGGALLLAAVADHHSGRLLGMVVGALALLALYLPLWFFGGMGLGDVKLAGVLGGFLGYLGLAAWVVGAFSCFVLGGALAVVLLATGRVGRKSKIPHGPSMLAGALVGVLLAGPLAAAYLSVSGL